MKSCMIDLETLSQDSNAVILSIGAVVFDPDSNRTGEEFYTVINTNDCVMNHGLHIDMNTVNWWKQQNDEAQKVLREAQGTDKTLEEALEEFTSYWERNNLKYIWGNGAGFDEPILATAYRSCGYERDELPWNFWDSFCVRTIGRLFPGHKPERNSTHHNSLDDALWQVKWMQNIFDE